MLAKIKRLLLAVARPMAIVGLLTGAFASQNVYAAQVYWTDWQTSSTAQGGFTGYGQITTATATVNVTYHNDLGISFYYTGAPGETDFWQNGHSGRNPARSPYTSSQVDNIPTGTDLIALNRAGSQTLQFSEAIANPVFSYVSLNGNGYAFLNQDFDILSFGDGTNRDAGYWGPGTSYKNVVDLGGGNFEYQLLGTGEPHGTIQFKGAFSSLTWRSLSNENWNGFTVGIQGTAVEVFTPEPSTIATAAFGILTGLAAVIRRRTRVRAA